jgi:class 3 adenylate cyclase
MAGEKGLLGVAFVDVCGSTALYRVLGDESAHRLVERCLSAMRATVAEFGGRVVKSIGDALLCVFDDADGAIGAASEMQARLGAQRGADPSVPMIRIGVGYGPVLEADGDVFGDTVNLAARMAELASAGQVLTTQPVVAALPPALRASCRSLHAHEIRGVDARVPLYDVVWNTEASLTVVVAPPDAAAVVVTHELTLCYKDRALRVDATRGAVQIGRDRGCDLVVDSPMASRRHARVFLHEGSFVLLDQSANGTYLQLAAASELHLRREQTRMSGQGVIGLGVSPAQNAAEAIRFSVS